MFRILTVSREFGSGGGTIAQIVAERLGWDLLDKALIESIARTANVDADLARRYDERVDSWLHRINRGGLHAAAISGGATTVEAEIFDAASTAALAQRTIREAADKGNCVIVGRGAQCVLQERQDALHVFVYAPWASRVERLRARLGAVERIGELMRQTDHERASYIRTYYGCDWKDLHLYHMMITSQLGDETVAGIIANAIESAATK
jgi:cytidylate kinase